MEKVIEMFGKMNEKAENIREAMAIIPHLPNNNDLSKQLAELGDGTKEVKELEKAIKDSLHQFQEVTVKEYKRTATTIQRVNAKMMYLLEHMDDKTIDTSTENGPGPSRLPSPDPIPVIPSTPNIATASAQLYSPVPPKTKSSVPSFDADITETDFNKLPSYLRGRTKLINLLNFLQVVIIRAFNNKYRIMYGKELPHYEQKLQTTFKMQEKIIPLEKFIASDDVARVLGQAVGQEIDKKSSNYIRMASKAAYDYNLSLIHLHF